MGSFVDFPPRDDSDIRLADAQKTKDTITFATCQDLLSVSALRW
jgi:hypothetical protein